ncbi:uncharacterized protein LOC132918983 [Rhopalosiphum padi]|uniref:uncharacterized protein LOC132918983 n=1 Tax=Rhopalosiphum padi TaxID=40932 RepID=UPI00298E8CE6|nr:uncharacterized protein LOC132918983 [Rhopalosiphum padi]
MPLDETQRKTLSDLIRKRGVIKASLTRIRTFVTKFNPREDAITLLEFRQEELPHINKKFDEIQSEIEFINCDDDEKSNLEREAFESDYFSIRSEMQEIINFEKGHTSLPHNVSASSSVHTQRARLAPISLPSFEGDILEWESFFDCYKAMVHNDDSYPSAQKFSYLRSTLKGQALDIIKGIPITDANYNVAIKRLQQRFDNKSLVIQSHIRAILDTPRAEACQARELQDLYSNISAHVAALEALGQPVNQWDAWLVTVVLRKLDYATSHEWQVRRTNTELPKYSELQLFLSSRCVALESAETLQNTVDEDKRKITAKASNLKYNAHNYPRKALYTANHNVVKCECCAGDHRVYACSKFKEMPVGSRVQIVREARLCFNCFSNIHMANTCKSKYNCRVCNGRHNTLLHYEKHEHQVAGNEGDTIEKEDNPGATSLWAAQKVNHVFLATAIVSVLDRHGEKRPCRVVLDSGSQINFVSRKMAKLLNLSREQVELPITGIGANRVHSTACVTIDVLSRIKEFQVALVCHVLPTIVDDLSPHPSGIVDWKIPKEFDSQLADPLFHSSGAIDMLIGGGVFFDILESRRVRLSVGSLCLQDTKFGWVITGEVGAVCLLNVNSVGQSLEDGWIAVENSKDANANDLSKTSRKALDVKAAARHFQETAKRNQNGRFVLRLPLKSEVKNIGDTLSMAKSRFLSVERRLQQDESLKEAYVSFMKEYENAGHMHEVHSNDPVAENIFYLPHHPVVKLSSLTTKLRVVFDASAKSSTGVSLNDVLMCGPTVQEELFSILIRFRAHQYVITADVEKMFRQVEVSKEDQDLQRIVWRENPSEKLRIYRLTTVTYGTTSASFMATQCLASLAEAEKLRFPRAAKAIRRDFYMDDLMTGAETIDECKMLQLQISNILDSAKLPLRKWCSNSAEIFKGVHSVDKEPLFVIKIEADEIVKSLGLCWKPTQDVLGYQAVPAAKSPKCTKRILLSDLNRIFDPLGFLTPVLIKGKIFLQQLWQIKIDWDQPIPEHIKEKWLRFYKQFEELRSLSIPRKCKPFKSDYNVEVHGFCDASEEAYGACIYVRSKGQNEQWCSRLLCSKSRVAPVKGATIPRLELGGALVLAQLAEKVALAWELDIKDFYLWTDSMVALGWIRSEDTRFKTYVANRVDQILELTNAQQWRHVGTADNPADMLSRGVLARELKDSELWWNGPQWLSNGDDGWKHSTTILPDDDTLPEIRTVKLTLAVTNQSSGLIEHYSSWRQLVRAAAWFLKFIDFQRTKKANTVTQYLSVLYLKRAETGLIRQAQLHEFQAEYTALSSSKEVSGRSKLKGLHPLLQSDNLIRVGGRLENAQITENQKHPIVLPAAHKITRLIFEDIHQALLHCGPQALLAEVRQRYWPIRGRSMARSVIKRCVICVRARPKFEYPLMAPLPKQRVAPTRPFAVSGVDFAGPLTIRSGIRRQTGIKAWIAVFVCFSTRAIHLEPVVGLTSGAFLASLRRFMSRRGKCTTIHSDNGTNFIGAQKELASYLSDCDSSMAREGIEWKFNPPSAPHFGGLWESAVKSTRHHLSRILKDGRLNLEELNTLLCQIEACVNSRPMTPLGSDPSEPGALTPAHFLIGGSLLLAPEPSLADESIEHLRRWKYVQALMQGFWARWYKEYLPQLQVRGKWTSSKPPVNIDDIVIIKDECTPPAKWRLGRVMQVHPGKDGIVRVATLRLGSGAEIKRPTVKLCALPTERQPE